MKIPTIRLRRVIQILRVLVLACTLVCLGLSAWGAWRLWPTLRATAINLERASGESAQAAADAKTLVALYTDDLRSARNRKAVEAGLAAAASWQATARLVNTQLVPQATATLASLEASNREIQALVRRQNGELALTQAEVREVAEALAGQIQTIGPDAQALLRQSTAVALEGEQNLQILAEANKNLALTSANIAASSAEAPKIARSLEKIAASGSRWQRPVSIATILIALLGALR